MGTTTTATVTFDEFERMPEEENDWKTELIDGELIRRLLRSTNT